MRFFLLLLLSCTSFAAPAQINPQDSLWFEEYFLRVRDMRDRRDPQMYDSLEIVGKIAEAKKDQTAICRYYVVKAGSLIASNKADEATALLQDAIRISEKEKLPLEAASAYLHLGNYYQFNGNTLAAAENYLAAARYLRSTGNKRVLIGLYRNLFTILNRLQQKNTMLENTYAAIKADKSNSSDLIRIINNKGSEETGFHFPEMTMIREGGTGSIYVIFGDAKFPITSFQDQASYGSVRDIQRVPPGTLEQIPDFPRNGSIFRQLDEPYIYLAKDDSLYQINSFDVLEEFGGWDAVYYPPPGSLKKFPISRTQVTLENIKSLFNLRQEFDILTGSIDSALQKNKLLSSDLSQFVSRRNRELQRRKTTLWASFIGILALLVIVFLLVRNFRQKQKLNAQTMLTLKKQEDLERKTAIEKERTRIATDMHDDLGAGLSRIKFLSETIGLKQQQEQPVEEDIRKIREYSHEMIDKMGEIVWALNEKNDSLDDLLSYTRSYAAEYLSQNGITCTVNIPGNVPAYSLGAEWRRNIYLTVKEALHNVVKHAAASQVILDIRAGKELEISIRDNGIGFREGTKPFRNGISNMRTRMQAIGGRFEIENDRGTCIKLAAPLNA